MMVGSCPKSRLNTIAMFGTYGYTSASDHSWVYTRCTPHSVNTLVTAQSAVVNFMRFEPLTQKSVDPDRSARALQTRLYDRVSVNGGVNNQGEVRVVVPVTTKCNHQAWRTYMKSMSEAG